MDGTRPALEVYTRSIGRRWVKEVRAAGGRLIVVSPYLTSDTAERVLLQARPQAEPPTVLTTFTTEVFATGASHLKTLRKLIGGGCRVYHVDALHAKIVLIDRFVSVGSQNLTKAGVRNREATVAITDPQAIAEVRQGIERWQSLARPIDLTMIEMMERQMKPLRARIAQLKRDLAAADNEIQEEIERRERERIEAERHRKDEEEQRRKREQDDRMNALRERSCSLRGALVKTRYSDCINVTLMSIPWESDYGAEGITEAMRRSNPRDDMRRWAIGGETIVLTRGHYYLLVAKETGRLALIKAMKVQTSCFILEVRFGKTLDVGKIPLYVGLKFADQIDDLLKWNVKFVLALSEDAVKYPHWDRFEYKRVEVRCYFDVDGMSVESVSGSDDADLKAIGNRLSERDTHLIKSLRSYLLDARKFRPGGYISSPWSFLRGYGDRFRLRLHKLGTSLFLTAEQTH